MHATEHSIDIPGGTIAARLWGRKDAPPVVCVHGWLDNAASFDRLAAELPELRLIAIDLPGHGNSTAHPPGLPYLFVDHVAALHHAIEGLGLERPSLMGHSLGAGVCAVWAGTFPERARRLVMLEGLGPLTQDESTAPSRLRQALETEVGKKRSRAPVYPDRQTVLERLLNANRSMERESARRLLERALVDVDGGVSWKSDAKLRLPSRLRLTEGQVLAFLRAIECPSLVVRAEEGFPVDPQAAKARVEALGAQVVHVPGGHHVHLDDPNSVARAVDAFFEAEAS